MTLQLHNAECQAACASLQVNMEAWTRSQEEKIKRARRRASQASAAAERQGADVTLREREVELALLTETNRKVSKVRLYCFPYKLIMCLYHDLMLISCASDLPSSSASKLAAPLQEIASLLRTAGDQHLTDAAPVFVTNASTS